MIKQERLSSSPKRRNTALSSGSSSRFKRKREPYDSESNKSIYVFPVPTSYTYLDVKNMFGGFGDVANVKLLSDRGDKNGFPCFVDFKDHDAAIQAKQAYDGSVLSDVFEAFPHREDCLIVKFSEGKRKKPKVPHSPRVIKGERVERRSVERRSDGGRSVDQPSKLFSRTNVYVCPVALEVSERLLKKTFSYFGKIIKVTLLVRKGRKLGRTTGYPAFVQFEQENSAQRAVEALNGLAASEVFKGYKGTEVLAVRFAEISNGKRTRRDIELEGTERRIYVFPLPQYIKERELTHMFERFGSISKVHIIKRSRKLADPNAGIPAFVIFNHHESAKEAVDEFNGVKLEDVLESYRGDDILVVTFPVQKPQKRARRRLRESSRRKSRKEHIGYGDERYDPSVNVSGPSEMDFSIEADFPSSPVRRYHTPTRSPSVERYYRKRTPVKRDNPVASIDDLDHDDPEELELARKEYELLASLAAVRKDRLALRKARESRQRRR